MGRTHLRHINLREWFPADDPIAVLIARLSILREDYFLELQGIVKKEFNPFDEKPTLSAPDSLDGNSSGWRRLYFFRNSLRTLNEIRNAVERLFVDQTQKDALAKECVELRDAFKKLKEEIGAIAPLIKDLRDRIGGHVLHAGVMEALDKIDPGHKALLEEATRRIHYKFTGDLVLVIMFPGKSGQDLIVDLEDLLEKTAKLITIVSTIDDIIGAYNEARKLR